MTKKQLPLLAALVVAFLLNFASIDSLKAQTDNRDSLNKIANIFLGKWLGEVVGPNGEKLTTELIFEWTLKKKFIKTTNLLGPEKTLFAQTIYGWQPVLNQIVFWSFDSEGTINEGLAKLENNTLKHEWRAFRSNGQIEDWRSSLTLTDETLVFTITESRGAQTAVRYKRLKE